MESLTYLARLRYRIT